MLLGTLVFVLLSGCHQEPKGPSPTASPHSTPSYPKVTYHQPSVQSIDRTLPLVGTVVVDKSVKVPSMATGQIVEVHCSQGERVSQGQILATVDTGDSQLAVKKAQAELGQELATLGLKSTSDKLRSLDDLPNVAKAKATMDNAAENLERFEVLHKQHLVSDVDYSDRKTAYVTARADYQAARETVSQNLASVEVSKLSVEMSKKKVTDAMIVAPVSGVVDEVTTAPGAYVSAGSDTGIIILKDRPLFLAVEVPQSHIAELSVGKVMTFKTQVYHDYLLSARVAQIGGRVNPKSGALPVRAEILNPPLWLVPGLSAEVQLIAEKLRDRLLIPQAAVLTQAGNSYVFLVKESHGKLASVKRVPVTLRQPAGDWILIEGPVKVGDKLITSDLLGLEDGTEVELKGILDLPAPEAVN